MKRLFAVGLGLAVVGLAGTGRADDKDDNAKLIVGNWELAKSGGDLPPGSVMEFTKDGKFSVTFKADQKDVKVEGTYKVEKEKLSVKFKLEGKDFDETATIKKLTADALHIEDKDKQVDEFKKVKK